MPNDVALAELAPVVAEVLSTAAARTHHALDSRTNRTYLTYRGEDLLGVVRRGNCHIFVKPSGSTSDETHDALLAAGFTYHPKIREHDHPWYRAAHDNCGALRRAIRILRGDVRARNTV